MPLTEQQKSELIYDIVAYLVPRVEIAGAEGPRIDVFQLLSAILKDTQYEVTNKLRMVIALKQNTDLWHRAAAFLKHQNNDWCATKGCGHYKGNHPNLDACTDSVIKYDYTTGYASKSESDCKCKGFRPKLL